ncbi:MAG: ABC transporter substrate-binding protein, partial [Ahrensia sp.]
MVRRLLCHFVLAIAVSGALTAAHAQEAADKIGVALPQTGPYALFGTQFLQGLQASPVAVDYEFESVDTACSRAGGEAVAPQINASIIVGFPCVDALDAAQQTAALAGKTIVVPFAGPVSQAPATDTTHYARTISFGPAPSDETDTLADYVTSNWRDKSIAVIDDGTLYGRQIAENVLAAMAEQNLTPVYTTTFRPQLDNQVGLVRLLQRAGATHVVVGGDRFDAAAIANGTAIVGHRLTLAGGTA